MKRPTDQSFASLQNLASLQRFASLESLMAEISRSPIIITQPRVSLPEGFEEVDRTILTWIAGEAHRTRRHATLM
jgi:hypothetical protein